MSENLSVNEYNVFYKLIQMINKKNPPLLYISDISDISKISNTIGVEITTRELMFLNQIYFVLPICANFTNFNKLFLTTHSCSELQDIKENDVATNNESLNNNTKEIVVPDNQLYIIVNLTDIKINEDNDLYYAENYVIIPSNNHNGKYIYDCNMDNFIFVDNKYKNTYNEENITYLNGYIYRSGYETTTSRINILINKIDHNQNKSLYTQYKLINENNEFIYNHCEYLKEYLIFQIYNKDYNVYDDGWCTSLVYNINNIEKEEKKINDNIAFKSNKNVIIVYDIKNNKWSNEYELSAKKDNVRVIFKSITEIYIFQYDFINSKKRKYFKNYSIDCFSIDKPKTQTGKVKKNFIDKSPPYYDNVTITKLIDDFDKYYLLNNKTIVLKKDNNYYVFNDLNTTNIEMTKYEYRGKGDITLLDYRNNKLVALQKNEKEIYKKIYITV